MELLLLEKQMLKASSNNKQDTQRVNSLLVWSRDINKTKHWVILSAWALPIFVSFRELKLMSSASGCPLHPNSRKDFGPQPLLTASTWLSFLPFLFSSQYRQANWDGGRVLDKFKRCLNLKPRGSMFWVLALLHKLFLAGKVNRKARAAEEELLYLISSSWTNNPPSCSCF